MSVPEYDLLIVGLGPAGLGCVETLARTGFSGSVLMIDAGRSYSSRYCPADNLKECNGCGGVCNVIAGFGGSIHYGDGLKLSQFPSGRRLSGLMGTDGIDSMRDALTILLGDAPRPFRNPVTEALSVQVKSYPTLALRSDEVKAIIEALSNNVHRYKNVSVRMYREATRIEPSPNGFTISIATPAGAKPETVVARRVVVAVGRKGLLWWKDELRRLGLEHTAPVPSVGMRVECPKRFLISAARCHPDFKTTIFENGIKFKTFCFCSGEGGGRIKFTDYGPFTLLDGHVIPEPDTTGQTANFALLAQLHDQEGNPRTFQWVYDNIVTPYIHLNPLRPGKPLLQWYPDFTNRSLTCDDLPSFKRLTGVTPSVSDFTIGNLASLLSIPLHRAFCNVTERLLALFHDLSELSVVGPFDLWSQSIGIAGLELEGLWDVMTLTPNMESSLQGLYVIGDCAGVAQGVLQGMTAGVQSAKHIVAVF